MMMFMSTRAHASISVPVYVAPLSPTDGNLRRNVEGLPIQAPPPPPFPLLSPIFSLPSCRPPAPASPTSPCAHRAERNASISPRQAPQPGCGRWKPSPPCYHAETNLAPRLTHEAPAERGRKRRCNIHMKITRLAAM